MEQMDLARKIGRDPAWVSRNLRAPGNWTLRTFGEFIAALDGEVDIVVRPQEERGAPGSSDDAYLGYGEQGVGRRQPPAIEHGRQTAITKPGDQRLIRQMAPAGVDAARQMIG